MGSHAPRLFTILAANNDALTAVAGDFNDGDIAFVQSSLQYYQFSSTSNAAEDGFNTLPTNLGGTSRWLRVPNYIDWLLDEDPSTVGTSLAITRSAGLVQSLIWTNTSTGLSAKSIAISRSGSFVSTVVTKVFQPDGITIAAQTTATCSYSGSLVTSIATTRDV